MSTEVIVKELPLCDICYEQGKVTTARYDSRIPGQTAWAFMCEEHYDKLGLTLGTGRAQRLILAERNK